MSKADTPTPPERIAASRTTPPRVIPPDSEPLTAAELREIRESEAALRHGDYVTLEELENNVARLRSKEAREKASL